MRWDDIESICGVTRSKERLENIFSEYTITTELGTCSFTKCDKLLNNDLKRKQMRTWVNINQCILKYQLIAIMTAGIYCKICVYTITIVGIRKIDIIPEVAFN